MSLFGILSRPRRSSSGCFLEPRIPGLSTFQARRRRAVQCVTRGIWREWSWSVRKSVNVSSATFLVSRYRKRTSEEAWRESISLWTKHQSRFLACQAHGDIGVVCRKAHREDILLRELNGCIAGEDMFGRLVGLGLTGAHLG